MPKTPDNNDFADNSSELNRIANEMSLARAQLSDIAHSLRLLLLHFDPNAPERPVPPSRDRTGQK